MAATVENLRERLQEAVTAITVCLTEDADRVLLFGSVPLTDPSLGGAEGRDMLQDARQVLMAGNGELSTIMAKDDLMLEAAAQEDMAGAALEELRRRLQMVREFREATVAVIHALQQSGAQAEWEGRACVLADHARRAAGLAEQPPVRVGKRFLL